VVPATLTVRPVGVRNGGGSCRPSFDRCDPALLGIERRARLRPEGIATIPDLYGQDADPESMFDLDPEGDAFADAEAFTAELADIERADAKVQAETRDDAWLLESTNAWLRETESRTH
jgi:hypothetical protein